MSESQSTTSTRLTEITGRPASRFSASIFCKYNILSPVEHPFEAEREYQRALNAVKLERVFAKPFLGSLDGHRDGLTCVSKHPSSLSTLCSASADGEVRVWHLTERKCLASWQVTGAVNMDLTTYLSQSVHNMLTFSLKAHEGVVRGCSYVPGGSHILTCADDKTIKLWDAAKWNDVPVDTIVSKHMVSLGLFTNETLLLTDILAFTVDVQ